MRFNIEGAGDQDKVLVSRRECDGLWLCNSKRRACVRMQGSVFWIIDGWF